MKRLTRAILTGLFLFSFRPVYAQFDFNSGNSIYSDLSNAAVPVPAAPAGAPDVKSGEILPAAEKKWTVMVFMNGKNNLETAGLYNVNQMERAGSTADMNIVVEFGRMKGQEGDTALDGDWTGTRRLLITKDSDAEKITSPVVMTSGKADMGDYKRAVDFVAWAKKAYPAKRYMLILWDHGSGWLDPRQAKRASRDKGISFDDETGNYIRTPQLGRLLKETGRVDVLGFDACLMQTAEVAFEVKDHTEVIVGSQEVVPGFGYPYGIFLEVMGRHPDLTTEETGAMMVEAFKVFYDAVGKSAQLSAIRSSKLDGLGTKLAEFGKLAKEAGDAEALKAARSGVMRYDVIGSTVDPNMAISFSGDLSQYAALLAANAGGTDDKTASLKAASAALRDFIAGELVIANKASGKNRVGRELAESGGLSVYLPPVETRAAQEKLEGLFEGKYADLAFSKAALWHDFVTYLYTVK